jgi:hypothetical protein
MDSGLAPGQQHYSSKSLSAWPEPVRLCGPRQRRCWLRIPWEDHRGDGGMPRAWLNTERLAEPCLNHPSFVLSLRYATRTSASGHPASE